MARVSRIPPQISPINFNSPRRALPFDHDDDWTTIASVTAVLGSFHEEEQVHSEFDYSGLTEEVHSDFDYRSLTEEVLRQQRLKHSRRFDIQSIKSSVISKPGKKALEKLKKLKATLVSLSKTNRPRSVLLQGINSIAKDPPKTSSFDRRKSLLVPGKTRYRCDIYAESGIDQCMTELYCKTRIVEAGSAIIDSVYLSGFLFEMSNANETILSEPPVLNRLETPGGGRVYITEHREVRLPRSKTFYNLKDLFK